MRVDAKKEWIEKADHDFIAAEALIKHRSKPVHDIVCYHCQQCIEKYLKAFLTSKRFRFPKSHDLMRLLDFATAQDTSLELIRDLIKPLSDYAIQVRYPGEEPNKKEAKQALKIMKEARAFIRERLK